MRGRVPSPSRVKSVVAAVSEITGVDPKAIIGATKSPYAVTRARWECWRQLTEAGFAMNAVSKAWGCDSSSIQHAQSKGWEPSQ